MGDKYVRNLKLRVVVVFKVVGWTVEVVVVTGSFWVDVDVVIG